MTGSASMMTASVFAGSPIPYTKVISGISAAIGAACRTMNSGATSHSADARQPHHDAERHPDDSRYDNADDQRLKGSNHKPQTGCHRAALRRRPKVSRKSRKRVADRHAAGNLPREKEQRQRGHAPQAIGYCVNSRPRSEPRSRRRMDGPHGAVHLRGSHHFGRLTWCRVSPGHDRAGGYPRSPRPSGLAGSPVS